MMAHAVHTETLYGLMAEFDNPTDIVEAANRARVAGYTAMDAFTPFPIEELNDALGLKRNPLPLIVLLGGILGGIAGYSLEFWTQVLAWPMNTSFGSRVRRRPSASFSSSIGIGEYASMLR